MDTVTAQLIIILSNSELLPSDKLKLIFKLKIEYMNKQVQLRLETVTGKNFQLWSSRLFFFFS